MKKCFAHLFAVILACLCPVVVMADAQPGYSDSIADYQGFPGAADFGFIKPGQASTTDSPETAYDYNKDEMTWTLETCSKGVILLELIQAKTNNMAATRSFNPQMIPIADSRYTKTERISGLHAT